MEKNIILIEVLLVTYIYLFPFFMNNLFKFIYDFYFQESVVSVLKDLTNSQKTKINELNEINVSYSENEKNEISIFRKETVELQTKIKVNWKNKKINVPSNAFYLLVNIFFILFIYALKLFVFINNLFSFLLHFFIFYPLKLIFFVIFRTWIRQFFFFRQILRNSWIIWFLKIRNLFHHLTLKIDKIRIWKLR